MRLSHRISVDSRLHTLWHLTYFTTSLYFFPGLYTRTARWYFRALGCACNCWERQNTCNGWYRGTVFHRHYIRYFFTQLSGFPLLWELQWSIAVEVWYEHDSQRQISGTVSMNFRIHSCWWSVIATTRMPRDRSATARWATPCDKESDRILRATVRAVITDRSIAFEWSALPTNDPLGAFE